MNFCKTLRYPEIPIEIFKTKNFTPVQVSPRFVFVGFSSLAFFSLIDGVGAANNYWDGTGTSWSTASAWSTVQNSNNPLNNPLAAPDGSDLAIFNISTLNTNQTVNLSANQSAQGLSFVSSGTTTLQAGGTNRILTLGTSGIAKTGTGAVTIGSASAGQQVAIALGADQAWTSSNNTGAIQVLNGVTSSGGSRTLTLAGTSTALNTVSGVISNSGTNVTTLTKTGTGSWYLSGANSYSGVTSILGGTLNVANLTNYGVAGSLGNRARSAEISPSQIGLVLNGGTLQYTGSTAQSTNREIRVGLGGATLDASGSSPSATMSFTYSGTNTDIWDSEGARTLTLTGSNSGDNVFAINWQERAIAPSGIVKSGAGTWVLTNPHNSDAQTNSYSTYGGYSGGTELRGGTLGFVAGAIGGGVVNFTGNSTLRWEAGNTQDISQGSGTGSAASRSVRIGDGVTATFNTNGNNVTLSQPFTVGTNKTGAVTKTGAGVLTLTGANTYLGATSVNGGTLAINGNQTTASGNITVANGARLQGTGITGAAVTTIQSGATLAAGLTFNNTGATSSALAFQSGSIFEWNLGSTGTFSVTDIEGNLSGNGAVFRILLSDFTGTFWDADHTWTLNDIFSPGSVSGTFASIFTTLDTSENAFNGGRGFTLSDGNLNWAAVPEPSGLLAGMLLGTALLHRKRTQGSPV